jgi:hypothetical protein
VYTDVVYPGFMSPALIDLLRKMLSKNPETRITLDKIKEHHWFSQTEYSALQNIQLTNPMAPESAIDKEIVDRMTALGIECHPLHQQLLTGVFSELTAIYRQLLKERTTEKMKDLFANLQNAGQRPQPQNDLKFAFRPLGAKGGPPAPGKSAFPAAGKGGPTALGQPARPVLTPRTPTPTATPGMPPPPSAGGGPRTLQAPAPVQIAARRLSRPVAVRRMDVPAAGRGSNSLETP